jgi:hypothetical protein
VIVINNIEIPRTAEDWLLLGSGDRGKAAASDLTSAVMSAVLKTEELCKGEDLSFLDLFKIQDGYIRPIQRLHQDTGANDSAVSSLILEVLDQVRQNKD